MTSHSWLKLKERDWKIRSTKVNYGSEHVNIELRCMEPWILNMCALVGFNKNIKTYNKCKKTADRTSQMCVP